MNVSDRANIVIATKDELWNLNQEDRSITLAAFGIDDPDSYQLDGPSLGQILAETDDDLLVQLARHFGVDVPQSAQVAAAPTPTASATDADPLFVFASHLSKHKKLTWEVSEEMAVFGIDLFVAHESIPDDSPWQDEIPKGLNKAHAGVAFLHQGFKESDWCDQEVGWLLGRDVPVLGLRFDASPYGPMGRMQAPAVGHMTPVQIADNLVKRLSAKPELQASITSSFAQGLAKSRKFNDTDRIWAYLRKFTGVNAEACARILDATRSNDQVYRASGVGFQNDDNRPYPRSILDFLRTQPGWIAVQADGEAYEQELDAKNIPSD